MIENKREFQNKNLLYIFYLNERQCRINFVLPSKMNKKKIYKNRRQKPYHLEFVSLFNI